MINLSAILQPVLTASDVQTAVSGRIYAFQAPTDVQFPFVAYDYDVQSSRESKDYDGDDSHTLNVYCFDRNHTAAASIAQLVRAALDGLTTSTGLTTCELESVTFDSDAGIYGAHLTFLAESRRDYYIPAPVISPI